MEDFTMYDLPKIKVSFIISGDDFNFDEVTERLNINPSKTRKKNDFPLHDFAHSYWALDTGKDSCKAVSWQFEKIMKSLEGKESIIKQICIEHSLITTFVITIYMEDFDRPEISLTNENITFIASINAEVQFDLYND
jgi:hypothetical protein